MTGTVDIPAGFTLWEDVRRQAEAARTPEQQREYDDAGADVEAQIMLAELVYKMRTEAGITQAELARRMGTGQPFISAVEHGARTPTIATLNRIAHATGNRLLVTTEPV